MLQSEERAGREAGQVLAEAVVLVWQKGLGWVPEVAAGLAQVALQNGLQI